MSQLTTSLSDFDKSAPSGGSMTVDQFCARNSISRSAFYKLRRLGLGPDEMRYLNIVRITFEAEARWLQRGEQRARETTRDAR